jgi:hypothetical protein
MAGQVRTVAALAPLLGVGTVAIAADSLGADDEWPNPEIVGALRTFDALRRRGDLVLRDDARDDRVHLITGTMKPPLPEIGVFDAPVDVGGFDNFLWWTLLSDGSGPRYVPAAADAPFGATFGGAPIRTIAPPPVEARAIPIGAFDSYGACAPGARDPRVARRARSLAVQTGSQERCLSMTLRNVRALAALSVTIDADPPSVADTGPIHAELTYDGNLRDVYWIDPTDAAQEVPLGARSAKLVLRIASRSRVVVRGVTLRWIRRGAAAKIPAQPTCAASNVTWSEHNPLVYTVRADLRGRCTLVFRQSFAPIWTLFASGGSAKVLGHLQIDGFANGWIVDASGPVTLRIVNRALFAYAGGMCLTIACLLLAIGLTIRSRLRRAQRASRVPSPA